MPGTKFYSCDLHIHTRVSPCYKDKSVTAEMIVTKALEKQIEVIAITDHNTNEGIDEIRNAAKDTPLIVFPGVEITSEGGHIIALFDPTTKISKLDDLLTDCGIKKEMRGKEEAVGKPFSDIINIIADYGGIAIAAHADGKKGFLSTIDQGQLRMRIYKNPNLSAIELSDLQKLQFYSEGKDSNYSRPMPCIQSSDAHSLSEIGIRTTKIKMQNPSLLGLKHAFNDSSLRIKFPEIWIESKYPFIKCLSVDKGFLSGSVFEFNQSLNCLLGGAGSGKSTIIEFLRFAFNQVTDIEDIRKDCYGKIHDLAGLGAVISVEFINENSDEYIVERIYDNLDNPIKITRKNDDTVLENVSIKEFFPIFAYSQGEAIIISKSPLAQLELIDKHLNVQDLLHEIKEKYLILDSLIEPMLNLQSKIDDKSILKKEISTNQALIKTRNEELENISVVIKNPIFKSHQQWKIEEDFFNTYKENIKETNFLLNDFFKNLDFPLLNTENIEEKTPNKSIVDEIYNNNKKLKKSFTDSKKVISKVLDEIEKEFSSNELKWKTLFHEHEIEYKRLYSKNNEKRIEELNNELTALRKKGKKLQSKKQDIESSEIQLSQLFETRQKTIETIKDLKSKVFSLRKQYINNINKNIPELRITLIPNSNLQEYKELLQEVMKGSHARPQIIDIIFEKVSPTNLAAIIQKNDKDQLEKLLEVDGWSEKIINQFENKKEYLYKLESLPIEDYLEILFKAEKQEFRPLDKLSTGQKATVIVLLSMLDGISPIIFDQPEDALYTPFIYTNIVKLVRNSKENRQFIFATHNSNIAVASDLDLGIILESTSSSTSVHSSGGLDDSETNKLVVLHLEGGEEAIKKRLNQYQLSKTNS